MFKDALTKKSFLNKLKRSLLEKYQLNLFKFKVQSRTFCSFFFLSDSLLWQVQIYIDLTSIDTIIFISDYYFIELHFNPWNCSHYKEPPPLFFYNPLLFILFSKNSIINDHFFKNLCYSGVISKNQLCYDIGSWGTFLGVIFFLCLL